MVIGPPDDPEQIARELDRIQGTVARFYVRGYLPFLDVADASSTGVRETPLRLEPYIGRGRLLDLVLQFQSKHGDVDGWLQFVRRAVRTYGSYAGKLQITEEPNVRAAPQDGASPRVREAVVTGVVTAKQQLRRLG